MVKVNYFDFIIIGQGLAGSLLAWRLIRAGQRVLVIDNDNTSAASRVAAGLVNPVTGKRLVKEANVADYLISAKECYAEIADHFTQQFFYDMPLLRLFSNEQLRQTWQKRYLDPDYRNYISAALNEAECGFSQGGFLQYQTGYLSVAALLNCLRQWLIDQASFISKQFDYAEIHLTEKVTWHEFRADRLIFCEGARVVQNPWFGYLPMQPAKGEILTLRTSCRLPNRIINSGQWLLPQNDGVFKLGATYTWPSAGQQLDELTTSEGKAKLIMSLDDLWPGIEHYECINHAAGIRPNSKDKQALIGFHHGYPQLAVFNGFGSRGSLLIPYYSRHFTDVLLNGGELEKNVDIRRIGV